jgi:hypothetical protein
MSTTKLAAGWIQERSEARDLGRVVPRERAEAGAAVAADRADDGQLSGSQTAGARARLLGAHGGLDRILVALVRQLNQGPRTRASARASADHLVETIRALSVL